MISNSDSLGLSAIGLPPSIADAIRAAAEAAEAYRGATAPNPPVGCVLLDAAGQVLAVAAHERAGRPHAEAAAIDMCRLRGTLDRIRHVVVTLEPCNHWGRTPPCSDAILATPAVAVWIGTPDPNRQVRGGGAARLRDAGLDVHNLSASADPVGIELAGRCADLIAPFAKRMASGHPWVTIKQAIDSCGSMIPPPGQKTFTSPSALAFAHVLRRRSDAILTGSGTILADRPEFTVRRVPDHPEKRRCLVVLDRSGRMPPDYRAAAEARGFIVMVETDLDAALERLGKAGTLEVLVEAGPTLTAAVLERGLWDEHVIIRKGADGEADTVEIHRRGHGGLRRIELGRFELADR